MNFRFWKRTAFFTIHFIGAYSYSFATGLEMETLVEKLGTLWQMDDCVQIQSTLQSLDSCYNEDPGFLVLWMSEALVCEQDKIEFERRRIKLIQTLKSMEDGEEIRKFIFDNAGFDVWLQVINDPVEYNRVSEICRTVRENRFPGGEVAIWVHEYLRKK